MPMSTAWSAAGESLTAFLLPLRLLLNSAPHSVAKKTIPFYLRLCRSQQRWGGSNEESRHPCSPGGNVLLAGVRPQRHMTYGRVDNGKDGGERWRGKGVEKEGDAFLVDAFLVEVVRTAS